jgi:ElaB/YqjD/DUF883 family membrane-anchored ribosome-binding protein
VTGSTGAKQIWSRKPQRRGIRTFLKRANGQGEMDKNERSETMSNLKDKTKKKIDDAADAAKKAADQVIDKSKDVAHSAGKKVEEGGKRLQDA